MSSVYTVKTAVAHFHTDTITNPPQHSASPHLHHLIHKETRCGSFKEIELSLSRLRYSWLRFGLASADSESTIGRCTQLANSQLIPQSG
jgi:hypothetical protein